MGGDEFLAVSVKTSEEDFNAKINNFKEQLAKENLSVCIGFTYTKNIANIEEMVKVADKDMLSNKAVYYQEKTIKR